MTINSVCQDGACPFQRGLHWHKYQYLEQKMIEIARYTTIDEKNSKSWGEEIADILVLTGNAVDTFFKDMTSCSNIENNLSSIGMKHTERMNWRIDDYYEVFEPYYELSKNDVSVKFGLGNSQTLTPFKFFNYFRINEIDRSYIPTWWHAYNDTKHQFYEKMENANLGNSLNALAGLLILNSLHLCSKTYLSENNILAGGKYSTFRGGVAVEVRKTRIGTTRWADPTQVVTPLFLINLRVDERLMNAKDVNI